uniref:BHLH domain-containing protein n=2 Tax=Parascaris univalens TaxID=6257 RepID=A0A914ZDE8_PARUN
MAKKEKEFLFPTLLELFMAPSAIAIMKVARKRRSFEAGGDIAQKAQCLSEAEYSDDDSSSPKSSSPQIDDDRRAHHNELERRRRDHIKDHFMSLKDAIPLLDGEKSSRALILKRAVEYIAMMQKQIAENQNDIAQLRQQNKELETQIKALDSCRKATPPFIDDEVVRPSVSNIPPYSIGACMIDPSISSSPLLPPPLNATSLARIGPPTTASAFTLPNEFNTTSHLPTLNALSSRSEQQPSTDILRNNILRAVSNPLLNIPSILLGNNPIKLNQPLSEFDYAPDIHSQILANSLAVQERQLAATAVRF